MLVPVSYVISYEQRSLSQINYFQVKKQALGYQSGYGNNLLLCILFCDAYYNDLSKRQC